MSNFKVVATLWQICIVAQENTAAKRRLCTRANYECSIEVKSCGDSSRQLLTSATKCTVDVQLFRTKQNKACSAVNRHWLLSTVIPLRFKNWFVHMSKLHKPGSNTFVTNMLVQYPGRGKHCSMVESDSPKRSIVKHIWVLADRFSHVMVTCFIIWNLNRMSGLCQNLNANAKHIWPQVRCKSSIPQAWLIRNAQCRPHPSLQPPPPTHPTTGQSPVGRVYVRVNTLLGLP